MDSMDKRDYIWLKQWLRKQSVYSPRPYEQLANVLTKAGYKEKSIKILYDSKERERNESLGLKWIGLSLSKYIIGYGYYNFRALYWAIGLIIFGCLFLYVIKRKDKYKIIWCLVYSIDMLLPIIEVEKKNYEIDIGCLKYYFYFQVQF